MSKEKMAEKPKTSTFKTAPKVERVKLLKEGRAGIHMKYNDCLSTNGVGRHQHNTTQCDMPAPKSLRSCFDMLKEFLLENMSYHWGSEEAKQMLMAKAHCNWMEYKQEDDKFSLGGTIKYKDDMKIAINGPQLTLSGYEHEAELKPIIEKLIKESELFLNGAKVVDAKQMAADYLYVKKNYENPEDAFEQMTKSEQDQFIKEASECFGLEIIEDGNGEYVVSSGGEDEEEESPFKKNEESSFKINSPEVNEVVAEESSLEPGASVKEARFVPDEVKGANEPSFDSDVDFDMPVM